MTNITVLDHLLVVNLDVRVWTARKKLSPADLGNAQLPPEDLASLGSKRVCNPDDLKTFSTIKGRAYSLLNRHGVRFLGGWAIPEANSQEILNELIIMRDEFNVTKSGFLNTYDSSVQDWIAKHPQWGGIIAGSTVSKQYVSKRLSFSWQMFKIMPPFGQAGDEVRQNASELNNTLFHEIAHDARDAWNRCFMGKTEITRKALSPLKTMQQKLHGLSFLDTRVSPVVELIDAAFNSIPKRGAIQGNLLIMLQGLVYLMQNPQALLEHGQLILDGHRATNDLLDSLLQNPLPPSPNLAESPEDEPDASPASHSAILESHGLW